MNKKIQEIMDILQEECAEVIQEISKIRRFGLDTADYNANMECTHRTSLEKELGDLLAMIDLLVENNIITTESLESAKQAKFAKLKQWSTIYE